MGGRNTRVRVSEPIHGLSGLVKTRQRGVVHQQTGGEATRTTVITSVDMAHAWAAGGQGQAMVSVTARTHGEVYLASATTVGQRSESGSDDPGDDTAFEVIEVYP